MSAPLVQILEGNTFVVSDRSGDIEASLTDPTGLFSFDTRFLSKWVLTLDGERLNALSTDDLQYFESRFFLVPGTGTVYVDADLSVIRRRSVAGGFVESIQILNHKREAITLSLRIDAASDFADLFEVKDALKKKGTYESQVDKGTLMLIYRRETYERATWISSSVPAAVDDHGLTFDVTVEPHGTWETELTVAVTAPGFNLTGMPAGKGRASTPSSKMARGLDKWLAKAPQLECDDDALRATYHRSLVDLAALRFAPRTMTNHALPAAGLPWFMTIFGRDSIFTSLQSIAFTPELAATTLRILGNGRAPASMTSATRTPAASSTRCASAS